MPLWEIDEDYRREIIGRLKKQYQEAEQQKAAADKKATDLREAIKRVEAPIQAENSYPRCSIHNGINSTMRPMPAPNPDRYDRWSCPACGYTVDIPT
jgi:rubrerythrin